MPSRAQISAFRERLGKLPRPAFGVTLTDFHSLYRSILDSADALPRLMPEGARYRVLRALLRRLVSADSLPYFAPIADKPGFISAVAELIAELKEGRVLPERFAELATTPCTQDLAQIYSADQEFLRAHALTDNEGVGWLALPARLERLNVTLTNEPARRAHARFAETFKPLNVSANALETFAPPRAEPLAHLEEFLFEANAPQTNARGHVTITAALERIIPVRRGAKSARAPAYIVAEIAHRALQRWRFPHNTPQLNTILERYARERGLSAANEIHGAFCSE